MVQKKRALKMHRTSVPLVRKKCETAPGVCHRGAKKTCVKLHRVSVPVVQKNLREFAPGVCPPGAEKACLENAPDVCPPGVPLVQTLVQKNSKIWQNCY